MNIKLILRFFWFISLLCLLCGCGRDTDLKFETIPNPSLTAYVARGKYLTKGLAACGYCHGTESAPNFDLMGGRVAYDTYGAVRAANLTPDETGLADWIAGDVLKAIRESVRPNGEAISYEVHQGLEWMADEDLMAVAAYILNLKPINNSVDRRGEVGFIDRNTKGIFAQRKIVKGYVPDLPRRYQVEYGKYLVDHVARCGSCHDQKGNLLEGERYLGGGMVTAADGEERLAPDITGSEVYGLGAWTEDQIVSFLKTGFNPDGMRVDPKFCPVNFYENADSSDLSAIAKYLKSLK